MSASKDYHYYTSSISHTTMKYCCYLLIVLAFIVLTTACEREFNPDTTFSQPQLVVEGYINKGPDALPPYVILTKSTAYNSKISVEALNDLFVNDAEVLVSSGTDTVRLQEICVSDLQALPAFLRDAITNALGLPPFDPNSENLDVCIYTDLLNLVGLGLDIREGDTYKLDINTEDYGSISATTTIPNLVPIDSLTYKNHPKFPINDTLVEVQAYFKDPAGPNYYRGYSQRNDEPMFPSSTRGTNGSVTDDKIFDGRAFSFAVLRGEDPFGDFDFDTFGYFWRGDTVKVRVSSIDYEHFRFWQTLEYGSSSQGPFGTYTRVESNIIGGLGVWGGSSYDDFTFTIPE